MMASRLFLYLCCFINMQLFAQSADGRFKQADALQKQGAYFEAIQEYQKLIESTTEADELPLVLQATANIALIYLNQNQYEPALQYYFQALRQAQAVQNDTASAKLYLNIAMAYDYSGNAAKAREFLEKAIPIFEKYEQTSLLASAYSSMGIVSYRLGEGNRELAYYQKALRLCESLQDSLTMGYLYTNIAMHYESVAHLAKAIEYGKRALHIIAPEQADYPANYVVRHNNLAGFYLVADSLAQALYHAGESYRQARKYGFRTDAQLAADNLYQIYRKLGQYEEALRYADEAIVLRDSVYQENTQKTISQAEASFKLEKESEKYQLTQALQAQEIKLQRRWLYALIAGVLVLLWGLFLLYRNNRLRKEAQAALQEKNEELYLFNETLHHLNKRLQEADQTKATLLGIIGHDLRSPVGHLVDFLQVQKKQPERLEKIDKEALEAQLKQAAEHLLYIMEDLLLWAKSQMEHFVPELLPFRFADLAEEVLLLYRPQALAAGIALGSEIEENLYLESDYHFLHTILRNLLNNALKFTPAGGHISLKAYRNTTGICIEVQDNGHGMSAEQQAAALSLERSHKSSGGLGLRIVQDFAMRLGADFSLESELGKGTVAKLQF